MAGLTVTPYVFGVVLSTLVVLHGASGQAPKPCCVPEVFTAVIAQAVYYTDESGTISKQFQDGISYYDGKNNRTAYNFTISLPAPEKPLLVYSIQDFKNKVQYTIVNNAKCTKEPLNSPYFGRCIPDTAGFLGTQTIGGKFPVNRWSYLPSGVFGQVAVTPDTCIPVSQFLEQGFNGGKLDIAQDVFNFTASIDNPDQKFTPPSFCPKEISTTMKEIPKRVPKDVENVLQHLHKYYSKPLFL